MEDINNILNQGEVANLYSREELDGIESDLRELANSKGIYVNSKIYQFFVSRVLENLHIVLVMSPVGSKLRNRMRMFPSLVNCCSINWMSTWTNDALLSVGTIKLADIRVDTLNVKEMQELRPKLLDLAV